jgi:hypothetical protein
MEDKVVKIKNKLINDKIEELVKNSFSEEINNSAVEKYNQLIANYNDRVAIRAKNKVLCLLNAAIIAVPMFVGLAFYMIFNNS